MNRMGGFLCKMGVLMTSFFFIGVTGFLVIVYIIFRTMPSKLAEVVGWQVEVRYKFTEFRKFL